MDVGHVDIADRCRSQLTSLPPPPPAAFCGRQWPQRPAPAQFSWELINESSAVDGCGPGRVSCRDTDGTIKMLAVPAEGNGSSGGRPIAAE